MRILCGTILAAAEQYAAKCPRGTLNMNFTENHDTANDDYGDRMEKACGWDNQTLGLALCFAMHGIPLIYNGQEIAGCSFRLAPWGFAFLVDMTE